jgi:bifunctional enzyme CysN/CysC
MADQRTRSAVRPALAHGARREVHWQTLAITREQRAALNQHRPAVLWLTGLSGAGKSTLANLVEQRLFEMQRHTFVLDGDNIRHGLNRDLGFSADDRAENIRRVGEVTRLLTDAGLIVIAAFISPFRAERALLRQMLRPGEFFEIFVDTPLAEAEARDVKGLYAKARRGELKNFTGIDSPYEAPESPELRIDTSRMSLNEGAEAIVALLAESARVERT